jgi:hypothetical protein
VRATGTSQCRIRVFLATPRVMLFTTSTGRYRGKLAITIKVGDESPSTVMIDADMVADIVRTIDQTAGRPPYDEVVQGLAATFVRCKQDGTDLRSVRLGAIWTAFYHPELGAAMREAVSRELRDQRAQSSSPTAS